MLLIEENKMDVNQTEALIPFESPTLITIVAATNMGKTYFVKTLKGCLKKILKIYIIIMEVHINRFLRQC